MSFSDRAFIQVIGLIEKYKFYKHKDDCFSKEKGGCTEEWTDQSSQTIRVQYKEKIKSVIHDLGYKGFLQEKKSI